MNNMPKGFIEHFDDDRVIGPAALATEQMSEVLPFSQSEVRRIVEACGRSDILR